MSVLEFEILKYCFNKPYGSAIYFEDLYKSLPSYRQNLIAAACDNLSRCGYLGAIYKGETYLTYKGHNYVENALSDQSADKADAQGKPHIEEHIVYKFLRDHAGWLIALVAFAVGMILGTSA